jgi:hypothetical protein
MLAGCTLSVPVPKVGAPIAPTAPAGFVFGHVSVVMDDHRYPPANAPGWNVPDLLYVAQVRIVLLRLEPRQVAIYPAFRGDGDLGWLLDAGDYLLLGAYERDMHEPRPTFWPLAAIRVRDAASTCVGDLDVVHERAPEGASLQWREFAARIIDRCTQRRREVEARHGAFGTAPATALMVDASDLSFDDPALASQVRQRLDASH